MESTHSHLRDDGTVWPPVTPEPPMPPGYRDPTAEPVDEPDASGDAPAADDAADSAAT